MSEKPQQKTVEVTLAKDHNHAGKAYQAGAKIKVTEPERDWLITHKVAEPAKEK